MQPGRNMCFVLDITNILSPMHQIPSISLQMFFRSLEQTDKYEWEQQLLLNFVGRVLQSFKIVGLEAVYYSLDLVDCSQKYTTSNELDWQFPNLVYTSYPCCDPAICKHLWPVTCWLSAGSRTAWKHPNGFQCLSLRQGSHAVLRTNSPIQDTEFPSLQIPPTGTVPTQDWEGKPSWSSASSFYGHVCQFGFVLYLKNPFSQL